jgi:hypothetical protein
VCNAASQLPHGLELLCLAQLLLEQVTVGDVVPDAAHAYDVIVHDDRFDRQVVVMASAVKLQLNLLPERYAGRHDGALDPGEVSSRIPEEFLVSATDHCFAGHPARVVDPCVPQLRVLDVQGGARAGHGEAQPLVALADACLGFFQG